MKPIRLLTPILVAAAVVISSCSAPRLAQQGSGNDDVYNSVAKAQEYVQPQPGQSSQYSDSYDDNYGSSDPNYDMDYSSRINRFYYGSPYRNYYDPYYGDYYGYNGFYPYSSSWSLGFGWGFGNYYNSIWNPYYGFGGWGYSPHWATTLIGEVASGVADTGAVAMSTAYLETPLMVQDLIEAEKTALVIPQGPAI